MAAVGYFQLGELADNDAGIVCVLCDGTIKVVTEVLLIVHLISAYPMFLNPANQFFEEMIGIPSSFNWKRLTFRTSIMAVLLFLAESLPSFSAILQLISSVFVTCLTFVFPPLFYMRLTDLRNKKNGEKYDMVYSISIYSKENFQVNAYHYEDIVYTSNNCWCIWRSPQLYQFHPVHH